MAISGTIETPIPAATMLKSDDRGIPAVWPWSFDRFRQEMRTPALENFDCR